MTAQFSIREASPEAVSRLQDALNLPHFIAATLVARGVDTVEAARNFLSPSLDRDWRNPLEIPGLAEVADGLEAALKARKRIVVFGDFDLDGISATTVLTRGLRALGGCAFPFIPRRFDEGYGITAAAFARAQTLSPDVIVTVDCGISCKHEVAEIAKSGVEVYITDHHEAADLVPVGVPVADPKMGEGCPSSILAGVGVALKLVQVLGSRMGYPYLWRSYTDFAAMGTVADLMPMRDENRALVADGLDRINNQTRPCIAALLAVTDQLGKTLSATNLSFSLIPRLNAAGRMGNADLALDLLMCDNYAECLSMASALDEVNNRRRTIEAELSDIARIQAEEVYHGQRALVVAGQGWHEGVKGIVASRLVNTYGVPTLLFTIDGAEARGSGRSVGKVNLFEAVEASSDLITRFGGHGAAVGVTLPTENLPEFARRLDAYMQQLPDSAFHPITEVDAALNLGELTLESVAMVDRLAPFGQENPQPVFLARGVNLVNTRAVGQGKDHFACSLTDGRATVAGIMFHCSAIDSLLANDAVVDAAFTVQIDEWRGRRSVKAMLQEVAPARICAGLEACLDPEALSFCADLFADGEHNVSSERPEEPSSFHDELRCARAHWEAEARRDPEGLESALIHALIGDRPLHPAQRSVLDRLRAGRSTFAVMATGRGKSLCFQVYAAWRALRDGSASLFVYPLRALIADQVFHLRSGLERFGVTSAVLTGESTPEERTEVYRGLNDGTLDIVLTTPEYLMIHCDELAASRRIGFVVVDEAHHIGQAKTGQRVAYGNLGRALATLGNPVVLATTATANDAIASDIDAVLPVEEPIIDATARENLNLDDQRNIAHRDDYLATLVAQGEKTVVYVNSREHSVALARMLRRRVPQLACMIGFYNAGLSRGERKRIEELFRNDDLKVLVATSAFGEGVDIPNIRHVVLYHMPFSDVEFNQMSGRAGRDGKPSWVHLLYGRSDVSINERILAEMTPDHDVMAQVYRRLRAMQRQCPNDFFCIGKADLAEQATDRLSTVTPDAVGCGLAVFRELGLIETRSVREEGISRLYVRVRENAAKVELTDSVRYREGIDERRVFGGFSSWALSTDGASLTVRISHPIFPSVDR